MLGSWQGGDDAQRTTAARTDGWVEEWTSLGRGDSGRHVIAGFGRWQEPTDGRKPGLATAVSEEPIMSDTVEAIGQAVDQKAPNELVWSKRHDL